MSLTLSPLIFRLFEAAGAPLPTRTLPRAFAAADLRDTAGWRTEIEAAERLTRTGALPANRLLGLYTSRRPAASGGVWDRVRRVQDLDAAIEAADAALVAAALPAAWNVMQDIGLEPALAQLFAARLQGFDLSGEAAQVAMRLTLLSENYEQAANTAGAGTTFLTGLAAGTPDLAQASNSQEQAISRAFAATKPALTHAALIEKGQLGEAILSAATQLDRTRMGSPHELTEALSTLRFLGLEDTARRAALQLLILGDR